MNNNGEPTTQNGKMVGAVLVVGAGISGMQSALDLAEMGYKVYMVEKTPAIGGRMPMLDKTFPTNDCSMCIMSPKLVECGRHRNITIHTMSEITGFSGEPGNFEVTVKKQPRFVDENKCLGCGSCVEKCPVKVDDDFNQGLGKRKAIYKLYPQAYPNAYVIDRTKCLKLKNPKACGKCLEACKVDAIDHAMQEEEIKFSVGAVIMCPGFDLFDAELRGEYGYGIYPNVITSIQFERMLSASGPYGGHVQRPSDGGEVKKVAFIQCVGSRDIAKDQGYCSSVCCMYATKEAVIAKEHVPGLETTIFCMDVRAFGKDFEKYYNRAKDNYGVRYIKSMISSVKENPQNNGLRLQYRLPMGELLEEDFDLVVLSVGLKPSATAGKLASIMDLPLNHYNFCRVSPFTGVQTLRPGVYVAGVFSGPRDIPETVMQASAAAGDCSSLLSPERNSLVSERVFPTEKNVAGQDPRIGVFVCHCGINIGSVVNVPEVVEYAKNMPNVVHAQEGLYVCSQDSQATMKELIETHNLNRVVVASCSPRTHKPLFQETMRDAGLNKHLFEMANIRDQCSWVHQQEPEKATEKAKDLVKMAIKKSSTLAPIQSVVVGVNPSCLVIGGGAAGMNASLCLADQGYRVHLVEKGRQLGGLALRISRGFNGEDVQSYLRDTVAKVEGHPLIDVYTGVEVNDASGYVGNYRSTLSNGTAIEYGATIIATGGGELKPAEYLYGQDTRVLTQLDLDQAMKDSDPRLTSAKTVVMIQCVGSREDDRPYCSRVCCNNTMKLSLKLKEINPSLNVVVLYRDIRTFGFYEDLYREARSKGVLFIRYEKDQKPAVSSQGDKLAISVTDHVIGEQIDLNPDLLVLSAATVPAESNATLSQIFKVPLNQDKFFQEAHMKLRPVDFSSEGVFLCGLAHGPKGLDSSIIQGKAAAARAATVLGRKTLESKGITAVVNKSKCQACLTCVRLCPYNAPRIKEGRAEIEAVICQGCGSCAGECPNKAITLLGYSDTQYNAMLNGLCDN